MEREPGINNPYPLPSKRDIAITAIDAAIAEAVKAEREAIIEACNAQAAQAIVDRSHHALSCVQTIRSVIQQRDEADAAAIRARGNA